VVRMTIHCSVQVVVWGECECYWTCVGFVVVVVFGSVVYVVLDVVWYVWSGHWGRHA
jgi:hypothetical protein